jgi:hypothetical protein
VAGLPVQRIKNWEISRLLLFQLIISITVSWICATLSVLKWVILIHGKLALAGTYSRQLGKNFSMGLTLKYISSNLAGSAVSMEFR